MHACTCSAPTLAILYRTLYALHDSEVERWAAHNKWLLRMPMLNFGIGCPAYLVVVILSSWRQLVDHTGVQIVSLVIGASSVATVLVMLGPSRVEPYVFAPSRSTSTTASS